MNIPNKKRDWDLNDMTTTSLLDVFYVTLFLNKGCAAVYAGCIDEVWMLVESDFSQYILLRNDSPQMLHMLSSVLGEVVPSLGPNFEHRLKFQVSQAASRTSAPCGRPLPHHEESADTVTEPDFHGLKRYLPLYHRPRRHPRNFTDRHILCDCREVPEHKRERSHSRGLWWMRWIALLTGGTPLNGGLLHSPTMPAYVSLSPDDESFTGTNASPSAKPKAT
ncbi:hypothetical protein CPB84DRAFT_1744486 [Gymnopilus junonius]|uniref:Uncharacterized protein n=1 Tax=Gymnopilus junonius TaxID=109634 RepID=A0A9P5NVC5_GYMJU|nr:hypothetical protein CPB84DRAFT_1744486 [Gymnopilus junonius]